MVGSFFHGCVSSFNACVRDCTAVVTSSNAKLDEALLSNFSVVCWETLFVTNLRRIKTNYIFTYLASFCASVIAMSDGANPGTGEGIATRGAVRGPAKIVPFCLTRTRLAMRATKNLRPSTCAVLGPLWRRSGLPCTVGRGRRRRRRRRARRERRGGWAGHHGR